MQKHRVLEYKTNDFIDAFENVRCLLTKCFDCEALTLAMSNFIRSTDPNKNVSVDYVKDTLKIFQEELMVNYELFLEEIQRATECLSKNKDCLIAFGDRDEKHDVTLHLTSLVYAIRRFMVLSDRYLFEGDYVNSDILISSAMNTIIDYVDPEEGLLALELNPAYTKYVP